MVLGLQPSDVGILRLIFVEPGLSQQMLAARLGVGASRVVVLVDELEAKGLIARQRSTKDRRNYELQLTDAGTEVMSRMREIGADHENDLVKALSAEERGTLAVLLNKISHSHALTPDVHPGYRNSAGQ
jgi:DNA-binding MarR family transcriptional regulator